MSPLPPPRTRRRPRPALTGAVLRPTVVGFVRAVQRLGCHEQHLARGRERSGGATRPWAPRMRSPLAVRYAVLRRGRGRRGRITSIALRRGTRTRRRSGASPIRRARRRWPTTTCPTSRPSNSTPRNSAFGTARLVICASGGSCTRSGRLAHHALVPSTSRNSRRQAGALESSRDNSRPRRRSSRANVGMTRRGGRCRATR